jgi:hypothetical protein
MYSTLEKIKILLDMDTHNVEKDDLLEILIEQETSVILNHRQLTELPTSLTSLLMDMVVFRHKRRENDTLKNKTEGDIIESYITEYPEHIRIQLDSGRKIRVI